MGFTLPWGVLSGICFPVPPPLLLGWPCVSDNKPNVDRPAHRSLFPPRSLALLSGRRHELSPPTPAKLEIEKVEKVPLFFFFS